jgi:hypothetical protein
MTTRRAFLARCAAALAAVAGLPALLRVEEPYGPVVRAVPLGEYGGTFTNNLNGAHAREALERGRRDMARRYGVEITSRRVPPGHTYLIEQDGDFYLFGGPMGSGML